MHQRRVLVQQDAAALALRQGEQLREKAVAEQNGASHKGVRAVSGRGTQTEDHPFCFFLRLCKGRQQLVHRSPAQQGLVTGQEHAPGQFRMLCQQRRKSQPHGIVPAGQCMQEHRHSLRFAQRLHLRRAGHHDACRQLRRVGGGKGPAQQGLTVKLRQKLVGAKAGTQTRGHEHTPRRSMHLHKKDLRFPTGFFPL